MQIVMIKGTSQYDVLSLFLDEIAEGFREIGKTPVIFRTDSQGFELGRKIRETRANGPIDLVYTINILGEVRDTGGRSISDLAGAPHIIHLVDYPHNRHATLTGTPDTAGILTVDPSHVDYIKAVYDENRFAAVDFCPHGGLTHGASTPQDMEEHFAQKTIPLLFAGSYYAPDKNWNTASDPVLAKLLHEAHEIASAEEWMPAMSALEQVIKAYNLPINDQQRRQILMCAGFIHEQIRAQRRYDFINALVAARLPVQFYGNGYEAVAGQLPASSVHGPLPVTQLLAKVRQSRVLLNTNANFGRGSHERPLTAMVQGAATVTDYSDFYADHFQDGHDISLYRWKNLTDAIDQITTLLENPDKCYRQIVSGYQSATTGHRWADRASVILATAEKIRASGKMAY